MAVACIAAASAGEKKAAEKGHKVGQRSVEHGVSYGYETPLNQLEVEFGQPQITTGDFSQYSGLGNFRTYPSAHSSVNFLSQPGLVHQPAILSQPLEHSYTGGYAISNQYLSPALSSGYANVGDGSGYANLAHGSGYANVGHGSGIVVGSALTNGFISPQVGTTYGTVLGGHGTTSRFYLPPSSQKIVSTNPGHASIVGYSGLSGGLAHSAPVNIGSQYHLSRPYALTSSDHTPTDFRPSVYLGSTLVPSSTPSYSHPSRQYLPAASHDDGYNSYSAHH